MLSLLSAIGLLRPPFDSLTLPSSGRVRDFHPIVNAHAEHTKELSSELLSEFDKEYDRILRIADEECPDPPDPPDRKRGRKKKGKERALIERLRKLKDSVCLFVHDFAVPFTNNQAERDVRNVKTKNKIAGSFRTEDGVQDYLDIMSYLGTAQKHKISVFEALTAAFNGNLEIIIS